MEDGSIYRRMKTIFSQEEEIDQKLEQEALVLFKNVYRYMTKDAKDIMTHRKNIIALDEKMSLEKALRYMLKENYSRFPIYHESIDEIVGIIHLREAMILFMDASKKNKSLMELKQTFRCVTFIPETKSIDSVFKQMQKEKNHIAIVLDEYGQTSGLVAMEDILEEIVGNILDEHDEEEVPVSEQTDGSYLADGLMELEEIEEILPISFDSDEYGTLNGFLINELDRIPTKGEKCVVVYQGYRFTVIDVDNNTIDKVKIEKIHE